MIGGFVVDCDALGVHADAVTQVADLLEKTSALAQPVAAEAFGVIGRPFAGRLIAAGTAASGAIAALASAARADQAGLRGTAEAYLRAEADQVSEFAGTPATRERR